MIRHKMAVIELNQLLAKIDPTHNKQSKFLCLEFLLYKCK